MDIFDKAKLENLSAKILSKAKKQGATSAEVSMSVDNGFSVTARLGQVETVEHHRDKGVALTVYFDQRTGSTSSSDLSDDAIEAMVAKACNIAKYTSEDPYSGLPDKEWLPSTYPDLHLDHSWDIPAQDAVALAIECENYARQDKRITNSEGSTVSSHRSLQIFANSDDFLGSYTFSEHSLNCILITQAEDQMHRDYDYTLARDPKDLRSPVEVANCARQRTLNRLGARRLKTRKAPVIFRAEVAKSLLGNFVAAVSGSNIYRESSFLLNQLHKQIFPEHVTISQLPHIPKALGSAPFDNEGVRTQELDFVKKGVLQSYILSTYSAKKLNMVSTGNSGGVYNLTILPHTLSEHELIKQMGTGLIVTELIGQGVNIVTGDYSRGVFGFWVENGEIQYPVHEITIAGNLKEMFLNLVAVADDVDVRSRIRTGSILIDNMTIAGE